MIARKSKAPVVPCLLEGATKIFPRGAKSIQNPTIRVTFGKPLKLDDLYSANPSKETYQAISDRMMAGIAALMKI
jgi:1-acyl-sn-glycerol-3-phosphate acyltransferase